MPIRQPIVTMLGHIDTGKTSLLDKIRGTGVQAREAGGITQQIGASFFPLATVKELVGPLMDTFKRDLTLPGLLIIDTPGHAAFFNLRKRGGAVADIAILVVDIVDGLQPQTYESLRILRARKTPFLVALNKVDRLPGWKPQKTWVVTESINTQADFVKSELDNKIYEVMGELSRENIQSDRYDRITDFAKTVAVVPTSAKTGEGISELLLVLIGLAQQYLEEQLQTTEGPAKGVVLEVKEEPGLGVTVDTIIYDGILNHGDTIVVSGLPEPITTHVRALLMPKPLDEIRDPRERFSPVKEVVAAAGVKIAAPELDTAIAGGGLFVANSDDEIASIKESIIQDMEAVRIETDKIGVLLKADTLGSLEALIEYLKEREIPIRRADIGDISKKEVKAVSTVYENDPFVGVILAFNVRPLPDAANEADALGVPIFQSQIIYDLVDQYENWVADKRRKLEEAMLEELIFPGKFEILPGYVFRQSNPAVVGVKVIAGRISAKSHLITPDNRRIGLIQQIQDKGETIPTARIGAEVAVSIRGATVGRQIDEGDILYIDLHEGMVIRLNQEFRDKLTSDEQELLQEFLELKRKHVQPFWGV
ncbi:MAG: translation initiation factor IF-2 [Candidatus Hermodarchaeia archaeon]